jgi:hypothetical protein
MREPITQCLLYAGRTLDLSVRFYGDEVPDMDRDGDYIFGSEATNVMLPGSGAMIDDPIVFVGVIPGASEYAVARILRKTAAYLEQHGIPETQPEPDTYSVWPTKPLIRERADWLRLKAKADEEAANAAA